MSNREDDRGVAIDHSRPRPGGRELDDFIRKAKSVSRKGPERQDEHGHGSAKTKGGKDPSSAVVKITSFAKTRSQVYQHISYLTQKEKGRENEGVKEGPVMETDDGQIWSGKSAPAKFMREYADAMEPKPAKPTPPRLALLMEALAEKHGASVPAKALDSVRDGVALVAMLNKKEPAPEVAARRTMQMIVSTEKLGGYSAEKVGDLAREFGRKTFLGNYRYAFVVHEDKDHIHAHFVVGVNGADGKKLSPNRDDLAQWRQAAAEIGTRHGIVMTAQRSPEKSVERRREWLKENEVDGRTATLITAVVRASLAMERGIHKVSHATAVIRRDAELAELKAKAAARLPRVPGGVVRAPAAPTAKQLAALDRMEAGGIKVEASARESRGAAGAWIAAGSGPSPATVRRAAEALYPFAAADREKRGQAVLARSEGVTALAVAPKRTTDGRTEALIGRLAKEIQAPGAPSRVLLAFTAELAAVAGRELPKGAMRNTGAVREALKEIAPDTLQALYHKNKREAVHDNERGRGRGREEQRSRGRDTERTGEHDARSDSRRAAPETLNSVRSLSSLAMVRLREGSEVLLPSNAPRDVERGGADPVNPLRRRSPVERVNRDRSGEDNER